MMRMEIKELLCRLLVHKTIRALAQQNTEKHFDLLAYVNHIKPLFIKILALTLVPHTLKQLARHSAEGYMGSELKDLVPSYLCEDEE